MTTARIALRMSALGQPEETCATCDRRFRRGEEMTAVETDTGEPLGWHCRTCIDEWKAGKAKT